jgi:hypothetical protein
MKTNRKMSTFERFIYPAILTVLASFAWGCGSGKNPVTVIGQSFKHLATSARSGSHIYSTTGNVKAMALFNGFAATPSTLQQSFQGKCTFSVDTRTIPTGNMMPLVVDRGDDQNCNQSAPQSNPSLGALVIEDGTVGTLVVLADSTTAQNIVCKDLTNTGPTTDGQFVSVWFRPSDNAVLLFSGTTQLPATCIVPVPQGDAVTRISAQFLKS